MSLAFITLAFAIIYSLKFIPSLWSFLRRVWFSRSIGRAGLLEPFKQLRKGEILKWLQELSQKHGPTFGVWFFKDLSIFFTDAEDVRLILNNSKMVNKSKNYKHLEHWLGRGLITGNGDTWHSNRRLLTPAFHFNILSKFKQPVEENCKIMLKNLEKHANGEAFDVHPYIALLALDIICETAMGIKKHVQLESKSEYVTAISSVCHIAYQQIFSPWKRYEFLFSFTDAWKERNQNIKYIHDETDKVIEMRREALKSSNINSVADAEAESEFGIKKRLAFLDMLLLAQMEGGNLSDADICQQVNTFMFAGHDTTSATVTFTLYLLSLNKVEQQKAYEESVAMRGREKETMSYLEAVIKESLRLYSIVPIISRMMTEDVQLRDLKIPKGTTVSILVHQLHRNPKYFPNPEKFDPNRFLSHENTITPFSFIPFSAGSRNCIGQKFAMLEVKSILANILRAFEILPVEGFVPILKPEVTMRSGNGIHIRIKKRPNEMD